MEPLTGLRGPQEGWVQPASRLGTEDDQFVQLVQKGVLPSAALPVRLLHHQLQINLSGQKDQSGSAMGLF